MVKMMQAVAKMQSSTSKEQYIKNQGSIERLALSDPFAYDFPFFRLKR
jgi:hypothetical protein